MIGAQGFTGQGLYFGEIIMFNRCLSYFETWKIEKYLSQKWGIQLKGSDQCLSLSNSGNEISSMNNLALSYFEAGRRDEALLMQVEVLELCIKEFGQEHHDTLKTANNLAILCSAAGHLDLALRLGEKVLELSRKLPDEQLATLKLSSVSGSTAAP
jgi:tetratricopeptide (TPR) repeat protein